ncbi:hypothetical protein QNZ47_004350 [Enterobacter cloacae]|nr:hypothetical protein [Enterobacter cloacae]
MMKKTIITLFVLTFFFMFTCYLRPAVSIYNKSGDVVYLYKSTGVKNVEPDIEQAESSMRPIVLNNDEHEKIILSWQDLNLNHGQLYLGWKTKSQKESFHAVNGGKVFDIATDVGYCSYSVYLGKGRETFEPLKGVLCFKKIYMLQEK